MQKAPKSTISRPKLKHSDDFFFSGACLGSKPLFQYLSSMGYVRLVQARKVSVFGGVAVKTELKFPNGMVRLALSDKFGTCSEALRLSQAR